ncbi:hypothetical protein [Chryseobacterium soldanellicola]|uniref:hypothetical protein n=1 Tax=Chryseobacterium soldanellicola TaxID=311333 RepID=UPI0011137BB7|nr:hypothetical protein [Chryseobacterium soldanellicola]
MAISAMELQKRNFSQMTEISFVILKTTHPPTRRNSRSTKGLCKIPNGTISSKGNTIQWMRHNVAADRPI